MTFTHRRLLLYLQPHNALKRKRVKQKTSKTNVETSKLLNPRPSIKLQVSKADLSIFTTYTSVLLFYLQPHNTLKRKRQATTYLTD